MGKRCSAENSTDKLRWGWIIVAGDIESCWGWSFSCDFTGDNLLDSNGDNPLSFAGDNLPLNSAGDIYFYTPPGTNFQSLLGMILQTPLGIFLYSAGDNNFLVLMVDKLCLGRILPIHSQLRASAGESGVLSRTANITILFLLCGERMYIQSFSPTRSIPIPGGQSNCMVWTFLVFPCFWYYK